MTTEEEHMGGDKGSVRTQSDSQAEKEVDQVSSLTDVWTLNVIVWRCHLQVAWAACTVALRVMWHRDQRVDPCGRFRGGSVDTKWSLKLLSDLWVDSNFWQEPAAGWQLGAFYFLGIYILSGRISISVVGGCEKFHLLHTFEENDDHDVNHAGVTVSVPTDCHCNSCWLVCFESSCFCLLSWNGTSSRISSSQVKS